LFVKKPESGQNILTGKTTHKNNNLIQKYNIKKVSNKA
jgi:hypothetical protein